MGTSRTGGFVISLPSSTLTIAAHSVLSASDGDAFFEYGYVWLPYAIAALCLFALGAVAALRWRRSSPGTAEMLITSGALLAVSAAIVLGLADGAVEGNGLATIDPPVWQWMIDHRTPAMTTLAIIVTNVGSTVSMTIIATAAVIFLLVKRRWGDAILVATVGTGAWILVRVGKATVGRERPPIEFRLATETNESFPSGHALASAAILGVLLVVMLPLIENRNARVAVLAGVGLFTVSIGLTRLYLGVHWATDVIGGWVTGLAWLALCLTVRQVWRRTRGRPELLVSEPGPGGDPDPAGTRLPG